MYDLSDSFLLGALQQGARMALRTLRDRFVKGSRCRLCCPTQTHVAVAAMGIATEIVGGVRHLATCPISDLERALATKAPSSLMPAAAAGGN